MKQRSGADEMTAMAPESILRSALRVVHVAAYTTRNWTLRNDVTRQQINDLWEALHDIPHLLWHWREDGERTLLMYLDEYDAKWPEPQLRVIYEDTLRRVLE